MVVEDFVLGKLLVVAGVARHRPPPVVAHLRRLDLHFLFVLLMGRFPMPHVVKTAPQRGCLCMGGAGRSIPGKRARGQPRVRFRRTIGLLHLGNAAVSAGSIVALSAVIKLANTLPPT